MIRGKIRNKTFSSQTRDFSGLVFGKISPTDIDAFLEFNDILFVFIESKFQGAKIPYGQKLAFERLTRAIHHPPRRHCYFLLCEHSCEAEKDIDFANIRILSVYFNGRWKPDKRTALEFIQSAISFHLGGVTE